MERRFQFFLYSAFLLLLISGNALAESANWSTREGWVLRDGRKFFAVGIENIPRYVCENPRDRDNPENARKFQEAAEYFNLIHMPTGRIRSYVNDGDHHDAVVMSGTNFYWMFNGAGDGGFSLYGSHIFKSVWNPGGSWVNYYRMQDLKELSRRNSPEVMEYLNLIRDYVNGYLPAPRNEHVRGFTFDDAGQREESYSIPESRRVYMMPDEADVGKGGWCWPPEILRKYYTSIKNASPGSLVFFGMAGMTSRYFYRGVPTLTETLLDIYNCSWNGRCYNRIIIDAQGDSLVRYAGDAELDSLRQYIHENVKRIAAAYDGCCDVVGLNAYRAFAHCPELAGEVVDAFREGCPGKPVWLYFEASPDNNVYRDVSGRDRAKLLKCQVYTSIVHGATGVIFWTWGSDAYRDWTKGGAMTFADTEFYNGTVKPLARELQNNASIFAGVRENRGRVGVVHYATFLFTRGGTERRRLVAVNTSKNLTEHLRLDGFREISLAPYEVVMLEMKGGE